VLISITIELDDCSWYVTSRSCQLILLPSARWEMSTDQGPVLCILESNPYVWCLTGRLCGNIFTCGL